jgi:hypothetical protein
MNTGMPFWCAQLADAGELFEVAGLVKQRGGTADAEGRMTAQRLCSAGRAKAKPREGFYQGVPVHPTARSTLPAFRQRVQTRMRRTVLPPLT